MRILVLGGAGYIGSHTVYELIDAGYEVIVIRLQGSSIGRLAKVSDYILQKWRGIRMKRHLFLVKQMEYHIIQLRQLHV